MHHIVLKNLSFIVVNIWFGVEDLHWTRHTLTERWWFQGQPTQFEGLSVLGADTEPPINLNDSWVPLMMPAHVADSASYQYRFWTWDYVKELIRAPL